MKNGGFAAQYCVSFTASLGYVPLSTRPHDFRNFLVLLATAPFLEAGYA